MDVSNAAEIQRRLDQLRTELVDLAFDLERKGRWDAADVALTTSARVAELCDELSQAPDDGSIIGPRPRSFAALEEA
jgi:hypothetical protein